MPWDAARAAIDRLIAVADPGRPVTIGFLGGEPFANRRLIHRAVAYAARAGGRRRLDLRSSVTMNGTLLRPGDLDPLRAHPFAVTVSLDGGAAIQDAQRPRHGDAGGSFARLIERVAPLLAAPGLARIAARATVARHDFDPAGRVEATAALGFPEVGFAPPLPRGTPRPRTDRVPCLLGPVPVLGRLPSGGRLAQCGFLRFRARLARFLPRRLMRAGVGPWEDAVRTEGSPRKLLPRNAAALRAGQSDGAAATLVAGNPVATRLEAGVGQWAERRQQPSLLGQLSDGRPIRILAVRDALTREAFSIVARTSFRAFDVGQELGRLVRSRAGRRR